MKAIGITSEGVGVESPVVRGKVSCTGNPIKELILPKKREIR